MYIYTNLCKLVLCMMVRNSENPTEPPPSLKVQNFSFTEDAQYLCLGQENTEFFALPVKELKRRPVKSVWLAKVRLKSNKLFERDELGSIFALVRGIQYA